MSEPTEQIQPELGFTPRVNFLGLKEGCREPNWFGDVLGSFSHFSKREMGSNPLIQSTKYPPSN